MRQVTTGTQELTRAQQSLVNVARDTRSNFEATANLYARLARSTTELGLSQQNLLDLTTTINQSFAASGATAEEASNAITQLSQGLASGALRGDEFNSVAEQAPGILRAVAESLNMGIGELREFAATGGITAEIVVSALQQASDTIANDFGKTVATFGQQMETARTEMTQFVGENSNVQGVISALGNAIVGVTGAINEHSTAFNVVTGAIGGAAAAYYGYAIAAGVANKATVLFMRTLRVNPLIAAATAIVSVGTALYAARDASIEFGDTQGTLAQWMQGTWTTLSNIISTTFGSAIDTASAKFGDFGQGATRVLSYLWETFKALVGNIAGASQAMINGVIAGWVTLGDTAGIVARTIIDGFRNAFDNVAALARGFGAGLQAALNGDFTFTAFRQALNDGFVDPMAEAGRQIAAAARENFSTDYIQDFVDYTGEAVREMGRTIQGHVRGMNTEFRTLDDWFLSAPEKIDPVTDSIIKTGDASEQTASQAGDLAQNLNTLLNRLNPARARTQAYAQGVGLLNTALATGTLNFGDYQRAMVALQEELYNVEEETETATEEMSREWERFGNSVDETFKDAFKGAFDSFESFADRLKGAFENLMAELAYAAVKNEIKIQLGMGTSGPMSGGIGQLFGGQGGGLGGIGSLVNGAKSLFGFGGGAAATGYTGALGAATATGYGGALGSAVSGAASAGSGFLGAASAAMPWVAGGALIDNVLGLGIVDGIVGAVSGLFGGGKTAPKFELATVGQGVDPTRPGLFENYGEGVFSRGALGTVGFADPGTARLEETFGGFENATAFLDSITAMDNALASVTGSEQELNAMADAVQAVRLNANDAAGIQDQLAKRTIAAANVIDAEFTQSLVNAGATAEQITQRFVTANAAMQTLSAVAARLNLQWDAGAEGALRYADAIANQVGGVQQLATLQESYYQQYFTDAERTANLQDDLTSTLGQLGMTLPETREGFRALVEAQDLSTEAGQRNYAALLQVSGAFSELVPVTQEAAQSVTDFSEAIRVRESLERELLQAQGNTEALRQRELDSLRELAGAEEQGLVALQRRIWALKDEEAVLANLESNASSAMRTLQSAVQREQDRLRTAHQRQMDDYQRQISIASESIGQLEQFTTRLRSAIEGVRVESFALDRSRLQSARGAIASAAARGVTTLTPALESALGTVGQDSQQFYGDFESYVRDQVATSRNIGELYSNAEEQLTIEQRMLYALEDQMQREDDRFQLRMAGLDAQLDAYQRQIDATMGVDESVKSITSAIVSLESAIFALAQAAGESAADAATPGGGGGGLSYIEAKTQQLNRIEQGGRSNWTIDQTAQAIADAGLTLEEHYERYGQFENIPGFANGGAHAGGWRVVGERGPELEYTGPSRIMSNSDTRAMMDNSQVKESVDRMNQNLEAVLRGILEASQETASIMDDWDTLGQPGERNVTT